MTKPITAVLALQLWEEGAFELNDPVHKYIPAFAHTKVWRAGSVTSPVLDPDGRDDAAVAAVRSHGRPHLRVHVQPPGRRAVPPRRLRMGTAEGHRPGRNVRRARGPAAALPARHGVELLDGSRRARPRARGGVGAVARRAVAHPPARAAGHARDDVARRRRAPRPSRPPVRRTPPARVRPFRST